MTDTSARSLRIFLAEDNRADVYLVELALREEKLSFTLQVSTDGEKALNAVAALGGGEPLPDIALVDLNLPKQEGDEILRSLRGHPECGKLPIVIMTASESIRDRSMARDYGAVFFSKPADLAGFLELGKLVRTLCGFV